jgi:hypothetical protein
MNKQEVIQLAQQDPNVMRAADEIQARVGDMPITPEGLDELIQLLEFALENPEAWGDVRRKAIEDGLIDESDAPRQFNATLLLSMLAVMRELRARAGAGGGQEEFARGGLASAARAIAAQGRGGDTMLAHINPREAAMLRSMGGSGQINPRTGLPEFGFLKDLLKVAAPIVLSVVAPGLGTAIGTALGASGTAAAMLGQAAIGGLTSAVTGGDPLRGALMGGLSGGLGPLLGSGVSDALGLGLSSGAQGILGGGLTGALSSALTGGNPLRGALAGAAGAGIGSAAGQVGGALGAGGQTFGNMLTAGYTPREALLGGGLSGLAAGMGGGRMFGTKGPTGTGLKPSDAVLEGLRSPLGGAADYSLTGGAAPYGPQMLPQEGSGLGFQAPSAPTMGAAPGAAPAPNTLGGMASKVGGMLGNLNPSQLLAGASLLSSLGGQQNPQQAVAQLSPAQQEYFNRPSQRFDWQRMQRDASSAGMDLGRFMAQNWNTISSGAYSVDVPRLARGGALAAAGQLMSGGGSGRDDTIDARLSDGEYVMDAETVALLGDGSNKEGARRLDDMRAKIRQHKGKKLSRGQFSPDAKSPLAYLKGMN